jgi:DNA-binding transcriptional ArsR family regulator
MSDMGSTKTTQESSLPRQVMLSKAEVMALRPADRERYVQRLLLEILSDGKEYTVRDIIQKTSLARPTVTLHLQGLESNQQIVSNIKNLGAMRVRFYSKQAQMVNKTESKFKSSRNTNFVFFTLDSERQRSICIQEREKDEFGIEKVKGAITVNFEDFQQFVKDLNTYGLKVITK